MVSIRSLGLSSVVAAALALSACGGTSEPDQATARVGAGGGTLRAGGAALSVPANALSGEVEITLRVTGAHVSGRVLRVEVEPEGLALAIPALLAVQIDDSNARVRMIQVEAEIEHLAEVEVEDRMHHRFKTSVGRLGHFEVEVEHGRACTEACSASEECDDGVCKPHHEGAGAVSCDTICDAGLECDDGLCKPHGGGGGGGLDDAVAGTACSMGCASGLECEHGVCMPHGGR